MFETCDLHAHTTASDGSMSPAQLVDYARTKGLRALAVTDHETVAGLEEARRRGREVGVEVIPGVELGTSEQGRTVHMLGLYIDPDSRALGELLAWQRRSRQDRNREMIEKLMKLGFDISPEDFEGFDGEKTLLTRAHIGDLLARRGYGANQREVGEKYLDKGRVGYVERRTPTAERCVQAIHEAGGLAIAAHPNQISRSSRDTGIATCRRLLDLGADGIETLYCEFDDDWRARAEAFAAETGCLRSGGSDFHGRYKAGLDLGVGYGDLRVPYAFVEMQKAALAARVR